MSGTEKMELAKMAGALAMMSTADEMRKTSLTEFGIELEPRIGHDFRFAEKGSEPRPRKVVAKNVSKSRMRSKAARKSRKRNRLA